MLTNLKFAARRLRRSPGYLAINVVGLATGLACCAFIATYVIDELSYDQMHPDADRVIRVAEDRQIEGHVVRNATTFGPLAALLEEDIPAIEDAIRVYRHSLLLVGDQERRFQEDDVFFVDDTFLEVFAFPAVTGSVSGVLDEPYTIVLTESASLRLFGSTDVVGQTVRAIDGDDPQELSVTAVLRDPPGNTQFQFDYLVSFASAEWIYGDWLDDPQNWEHPGLYTFAVLRRGVSAGEVDRQVASLSEKWMGPRRSQTRTVRAERLVDVRLRVGRENELAPTSDIAYVRMLGLVAIVILILACLNFGNLTAARGAARVREFGTRRALGAGQVSVVRLLWTESLLVTGAALVVGTAVATLLMPLAGDLAGKPLRLSDLGPVWATVGAAAAVLAIGVSAVAYPAVMTARTSVVNALRGRTTEAAVPALRFTRILVVAQFVACVALVLGTLTVQRQVNLLIEDRLGFEKDHVVVVPLRDGENQINHAGLLESFRQIPAVERATASSGMPGLGDGMWRWKVKKLDGSPDSLEMQVLTVEPDYAETYGLTVRAGRYFGSERVGDAAGSFVINEAAAAVLGWTPKEAVGQRIQLSYWFREDLEKDAEIVGVVEDFQYHSLRRGFEPMLMHMVPDSYYYDYVSVRLSGLDTPGALAAMAEAWAAYNPGRPFEYRFLDTQFEALYRSEMRLAGLFGSFAVIAILVACLGLFGLGVNTAERRTKEIGIRKVLGASVASVFGLLSLELLRPVAFAVLVSVPLTFVIANRWLGQFAERVSLSVPSILLAGLIALGISWIAVALSVARAVGADPARTLRYE